MKSYLLAILSLITTVNLFSQQTHFPDSNAVWSVWDYKFIIDGDSTVNGNTYNKYYMIDDTVLTSTSQKQLAGLVREDTNTQKVWGIHPDSTQEVLLYDFSLEKGDSVTVSQITPFSPINDNGVITNTVKIDSVDTITINGVSHKRLFIENGPANFGFLDEFWVEGIGSNAGPLSPGIFYIVTLDGPRMPRLICFERNGTVLIDQKDEIFSEPLNNCYYVLSVSPEPFRNLNITLFPNPTSNQLRLQTDLNLSSYKIRSITGQTVKAGMLSNKTISVSSLNTGVYFLEITTKEGEKGVERFVVK